MRVEVQVVMMIMMVCSSIEFPLLGHVRVQVSDLTASLLS